MRVIIGTTKLTNYKTRKKILPGDAAQIYAEPIVEIIYLVNFKDILLFTSSIHQEKAHKTKKQFYLKRIPYNIHFDAWLEEEIKLLNKKKLQRIRDNKTLLFSTTAHSLQSSSISHYCIQKLVSKKSFTTRF